MDQYSVLARLTIDSTPHDRGIGAPPPVPGHEADRLASLARPGADRPPPAERPAPVAARRWRRLLAAGPGRKASLA